MFIKKLALGTAAATLVAAPVVAQSAPERIAPVAGESELGGESIAPAFIVLAIAAVGVGILLLTGDDDDDAPISA